MAAVHKFDSLEYSNRLRKAGFTEDQANVQAAALFSVIEEQLLTKQDVKEVEAKLSYDIKELEAKVNYGFQDLKRDISDSELRLRSEAKESELRLRSEIKESELRLFVRLIGTITVIMSVLGALLKFLPNVH